MQNERDAQRWKQWRSASEEMRLAIAVLALATLLSFGMAIATPSPWAYALVSVCLSFLLALFGVGVLRLKVSTPTIKLEDTLAHLDTETKELRKVSEALLASLYVVADVTRYPLMGGPSEAHYQLIDRYINSIRKDLGKDVRARVISEIQTAKAAHTSTSISTRPPT